MNTLAPANINSLWAIVAMAVALTGIGLFLGRLTKNAANWVAQLLGAGAVTGAIFLTNLETPGFRMMATIIALLLALKLINAATQPERLEFGTWLGFCIAWPGVQAKPFLRMGNEPLGGARRLVAKGTTRIAAGAIALFAANALLTKFEGNPWPGITALAAAIVGLFGLSLMFHFGLFNVVTGLWRQRGVPVRAQFNNPFAARTLGEFWGKRWNYAFTEMITLLFYRPIRRRAGKATATIASFLISGLAHELAISVPVRAGYGLSTLYFAVQAAGILLEGRFRKPRRAFVIAWLVIPTPLLFHPPFITEIVIPFVTNIM